MKRYAVVAITIVAAVGMVTAVFASIQRKNGMQIQFNTRDLPEHGIHIVTSVDKSFDDLAASHFKSRSPDSLKPLSVFVKNSGRSLVLAYALTWELRDKDGKRITSKTVGYSALGVLMGDESLSNTKHTTAIEPGTSRCFTVDDQIEQDAPETVSGQNTSLPLQSSEINDTHDTKASAILAKFTSRLSEATSVSVSLDSVVFEDGTFVGPNETGFIEQAQAMLNAKVDLLREIAVASKQGTLKEAFESIKAKSREADVEFAENISADDWYRYFRKIYAKEITGQYYAYGEVQLVPYLLKSYDRARPSLKKR